MNTRRVCVLRRAYYPAETHVRRNVETLVAAGYVVDLVCLREDGQPAFEVVGGVNVHRLPLRTHRSGTISYVWEYFVFCLAAAIFVGWQSLRHAYAVVEVDSMPDFAVFAGLIPRWRGAKLILYMFESMPEFWAQRRALTGTHWAIRLLQFQEKLSCAFAHAVIACHEMAGRALIGRGIPASKIVTILNVPDDAVFFQQPAPLVDNDHELRLVQHGTITESYGIQIVIEAIHRLAQSHPIHFDIAGTGEYQPVLEDTVHRLGLEHQVTFHGHLPREKLIPLLARATVGVVPMLFEYQSPCKLFEFVALGKPVIASDRMTFRQHFSDDEVMYFRAGDVSSLESALRSVCCDPARLNAQANRASARYEAYRWASMKAKYVGLYERLSNA